MNLRAIDLNLLTILHAVLEEGHVSRAATRLSMSQPAVSSALERCRRLFDDPLLERVGRTMRLTGRAEALRQPLAALMVEIAALVTTEPLELTEVKQTVRIVMADLLAATLAPALQERVIAAAPGIDIVLHPWGGGDTAANALARGAVDLVVSVLPPPVDPGIERETVAEVSYVALMRQDHPAAGSFDVERWLAWPQLVVSAEGARRTPVDDALLAIGRERRVGMVVPSFLLVPAILRCSAMIALVPAIGSSSPNEHGLVALEPPIPIDGFALHLGQHRRHRHDPGVTFVAEQIRALIATYR